MTHAANGSTCWSRKDSLNSTSKMCRDGLRGLLKFNVHPEEPFDWSNWLVNMFCSYTCTGCRWTQVVVLFLLISSFFFFCLRAFPYMLCDNYQANQWQLAETFWLLDRLRGCRLHQSLFQETTSASAIRIGGGRRGWMGEGGVGRQWQWESDCSIFKRWGSNYTEDVEEFQAGGGTNKVRR